ncbi:MAG: ABC transporter permease [Acidimicrobiales bacterium]|nr:ABC transporter permease [Acidimicrobiales bacterium]
MTATAAPSELDHKHHPDDIAGSTGLIGIITDSLTESGRHLRIIPRNIELLIFATIQPVMFVLLFSFVFGGSIQTPPGFTDYDQYLMPGIFAQTVVFGSAFTSIGIAEDMSKGFIDRLRSLPIAQSSVLIGRTLSDVVRNAITFVTMLLVAFLLGFRFEGSLLGALGATALLLFFSYGLSWVQALIGLSVSSVEAANSAGFIWMFPITFVSSAFIDTSNLQYAWLRTVADWNPFTQVTNAARALYNGNDPGDAVMTSILWAVGMIVLFAFLATRKFNQISD